MAEQTVEARIRDLERRLDLDPGSRLFVALAEEYRKVGRIRDALSALQKGNLAHPGYVAAQVALGRVYVEAKQTTDAIATFTKVLSADPGNLVAAKSLADIHLDRGDKLESLKKYKLYRALSGDRKVDGIIAELEPQVEPKPVTPLRKWNVPAEPLPPPPSFQDTDKSKRRPTRMPGAMPPPPMDEPFEITPLSFEPGDDSGKGGSHDSEGPFLVPTRDAMIAAPPKPEPPAPKAQAAPIVPDLPAAAPEAAPLPAQVPPAPQAGQTAQTALEADAVTRVIDVSAFAASPAPPETPSEPAPAPAPESPAETEAPALPASEVATVAAVIPSLAAAAVEEASAAAEPAMAASASAPEEPGAPAGRALADLYYGQGHYAEALQIYDDLVSRNPFDEDLQRMRRDAEARLLPAGVTPAAASTDLALERRLARIRTLKGWLTQVKGRVIPSPRP
jgi:tetratricopeptide (TPR) repeat protein